MRQPPQARSAASKRARGFTLIEVLMVLGIVAGLMAVSAYSLGILSSGDLKNEAMSLTASIKYMHGQAAVNNTRYRLVLDLDEGTFEGEVVQSGLVQQSRARSGEGEEFLTEEARALGRKKAQERSLFDASDNPFNVNRQLSFERVQDGVIKPGKLKEGVVFDSVRVGQGDAQTSGRASINFYPNGFQDPAVVVLREGDGEARYFTLVTEPMTGRVLLFSDPDAALPSFAEVESDD